MQTYSACGAVISCQQCPKAVANAIIYASHSRGFHLPAQKCEENIMIFLLEGEVLVSGSKNASLPILAATVLNNGITKLYNVPNIHDTKVMLEILKYLGCKVKRNSDKIIIDARNIKHYEIPEELMRKMRSSVILAGALIGRFREAKFSCPRRM